MSSHVRIFCIMKNTLFIDTSSNQEITVGLTINGKEDIQREKIGTQKAQVVLPMIEKLLKNHQLELADITAIEVNPGPGSFTGIRVGVSIANALAFSLKIPINGKNLPAGRQKIGDFLEPVYE